MKNLGIICGSIALYFGIVAAAVAAEPSGDVSRANLGSMGLGGMQSMSDEEGQTVRGTGGSFVFVHGGDFGKHKFDFPFDKKFGHHRSFDHKNFGHKDFGHKDFGHKKFDHRGFDHKGFDHRGFDHKNFDHKMMGHKDMGGGMIWQLHQTSWSFGGGFSMH